MEGTQQQQEQQPAARPSKPAAIKPLSLLMKDYDPKNNKSTPVLSKYERAAVLGHRIEQLARGSQAFVPIPVLPPGTPTHALPTLIAEEELRQGKIPFVLKRKLPDGTAEYWRLRDLVLRTEGGSRAAAEGGATGIF